MKAVTEPRRFDLVAVGGGLAGLTAACRTLELGGRALVLEHKGPYEELGRSYRLMSEVMERQGLTSAGDPVEVYWADPQQVTDPNDYVTTIEWPIADGGEWPPADDYFKRRAD